MAKGRVDPDYLDYIRTLECTACCSRAEPHHLDAVGMGSKRGKNQRGSDYSAIPLCRQHHVEIDNLGVKVFQERKGIDVWWYAWKLFTEYVEAKEEEAANGTV